MDLPLLKCKHYWMVLARDGRRVRPFTIGLNNLIIDAYFPCKPLIIKMNPVTRAPKISPAKTPIKALNQNMPVGFKIIRIAVARTIAIRMPMA